MATGTLTYYANNNPGLVNGTYHFCASKTETAYTSLKLTISYEITSTKFKITKIELTRPWYMVPNNANAPFGPIAKVYVGGSNTTGNRAYFDDNDTMIDILANGTTSILKIQSNVANRSSDSNIGSNSPYLPIYLHPGYGSGQTYGNTFYWQWQGSTSVQVAKEAAISSGVTSLTVKVKNIQILSASGDSWTTYKNANGIYFKNLTQTVSVPITNYYDGSFAATGKSILATKTGTADNGIYYSNLRDFETLRQYTRTLVTNKNLSSWLSSYKTADNTTINLSTTLTSAEVSGTAIYANNFCHAADAIYHIIDKNKLSLPSSGDVAAAATVISDNGLLGSGKLIPGLENYFTVVNYWNTH